MDPVVMVGMSRVEAWLEDTIGIVARSSLGEARYVSGRRSQSQTQI